MSQSKRLGMGLGALIGGDSEPATAVGTASDSVGTMEINTIRPNPYQPRSEFDAKEIESLADSLKRDGLLQPVVVRPAGAGFYQLVAGERRWRAAKLAGLARVPVIMITPNVTSRSARSDFSSAFQLACMRAAASSSPTTYDSTTMENFSAACSPCT